MAQVRSENSTELLDASGVVEFFCEALAKIDQIGSCRRLVFVISEGGLRMPVVRIVMPAEVMADLAQMFAADVVAGRREFVGLSLAVAN